MTASCSQFNARLEATRPTSTNALKNYVLRNICILYVLLFSRWLQPCAVCVCVTMLHTLVWKTQLDTADLLTSAAAAAAVVKRYRRLVNTCAMHAYKPCCVR
jgi:hypothetical protein